jgi:hypothetical protein
MKTTLIENQLRDTPITRHELAAILQDCWHYAALIRPPADGRVSTFLGESEHAGLIGKLNAYDRLREKLIGLSYDCFPIVSELSVHRVNLIDTEVQLREQTGYAITVINTLAEANDIDAYAGEAK